MVKPKMKFEISVYLEEKGNMFWRTGLAAKLKPGCSGCKVLYGINHEHYS